MEVTLFHVMRVLSSLVIMLLFGYVIYLYYTIVVESNRIKRKLRMQGIKGPSPSFLYGNLKEMKQIQKKVVVRAPINHGEIVGHDYSASLFPYFEHWRKEYGLVYTYSTGFKQHLYIDDPELVKELNISKSLDLGKVSYMSKRLEPIFGNGVIRANGQLWVHQRKIITPEFYMDKVKGMVGLMVESTQPLLKKWEEVIESYGSSNKEVEIRVDEDLRSLAADNLARSAFGSSYLKGKDIFSKLRALQKAIQEQSAPFTFKSFGFNPNKNKKRVDELTKEIETLIWETVNERQRQSSNEKDFMQSILEDAIKDSEYLAKFKVSAKSFIVNNCKNIYVAGHETTANTAAWCMMLLALHPTWQSHIREEFAEFCPDGTIDANSLSNLKAVTMVIQETLRLYPTAVFVSRETLNEVEIGNIRIPKGVHVWSLLPALHRDPNTWGPDANKFRPERFINGVSNACKYPQTYAPFGLGTRLCLGKNFAMVQLKIVLSLIISRFTFSLSPNYRHSPTFRMLVEPGHGVQVLIRKV